MSRTGARVRAERYRATADSACVRTHPFTRVVVCGDPRRCSELQVELHPPTATTASSGIVVLEGYCYAHAMQLRKPLVLSLTLMVACVAAEAQRVVPDIGGSDSSLQDATTVPDGGPTGADTGPSAVRLLEGNDPGVSRTSADVFENQLWFTQGYLDNGGANVRLSLGLATRTSANGMWSSTPPKSDLVGLSVPNAGKQAFDPAFAPDGRSVYFAANFNGGSQILVATRAAANMRFSSLDLLGGEVNDESATDQARPRVRVYKNIEELCFSRRNPNTHIWCSRRKAGDLSSIGWSVAAQQLGLSNGADVDDCPVQSADGKTLYFASNQGSSTGNQDVFVSTRADVAVNNWSTPTRLAVPDVNLPASNEQPVWVSNDGRTLYFTSNRALAGATANGIYAIYEVKLTAP
jgi:WD40-like Beta Propeller Repeat